MIARTVSFLKSVLEQTNDACELLYTKTDHALTRFADNSIHQSTETETGSLHVRVVRDGRVGAFVTDRLDQDSLAYALVKAGESAQFQASPERPVVLPEGEPVASTSFLMEETARTTAFDRAEIIRQMIEGAASRSVSLSGAISTSNKITCIVNSRGVEAFQHSTVAELNLVASCRGRTGYSYWTGSNIGEMPFRELAEEAIDHATASQDELTMEPGPYTVVLDHYAVGDLVGFLGYIGFGAKSFLEGRSFLSKKLGQKICSSRVTIWDDGNDPSGVPQLFDYEGVAKQRIVLVDAGVAKSVVTDSSYAPLVEMANTGHALPAPNTEGPLPLNLFMAPGKSGLDSIIAGTERGIYVRRFHYVNVVEPISTVLTGMTKDGTFLISNGSITNPVRNMRWTQSILGALGSILQVSAETRLVAGVLGPVRCPALKIKNFEFTGLSSQ